MPWPVNVEQTQTSTPPLGCGVHWDGNLENDVDKRKDEPDMLEFEWCPHEYNAKCKGQVAVRLFLCNVMELKMH